MANLCCVTGCTVEPTQDVYYFKLPTKPALRRRWLDFIKPQTKLSMDASVCSAHFATSDYQTVRGKTRLLKNKVPMDIAELKTQSTDDHSNHSNASTDSAQSNGQTDKNSTEKDHTEANGTANSEIETQNGEKDIEEESKREEETRDERSGVSEKADGETETVEMNGGEEREYNDLNSIEIQITPDIIEDYNALQVTPDIIEDFDTTIKPPDPLEPDITDDIEDILTNYHIMNPPDRRDREQPPEKLEHPVEKPEQPAEKPEQSNEKSTEKTTKKHTEKPTQSEKPSVKPIEDTVHTIEDDDDDLPLGVSSEPVFIEIPVDKDRNNADSAGDCLMVLESLQVNIDPNSLMLPEPEEVEQIEIDDKSDDECEEKNRDPISLLTSSDEDEVIIEEPHIDTVEVSDETDEDDVPLVRLVQPRALPAALPADVAKIFWGAHDYYCKHCAFATMSRAQYRSHLQTHNTATAIQICQICGFTTASEYQFSRHKKKHKEERRFKCHLCDYKARHNMSLLYHLKTHESGNFLKTGKFYKCDKCSFKTNVKIKAMKHMRACREEKVYNCDKCRYSTKRSSDLKRHHMRKHQGSDEDDETWSV